MRERERQTDRQTQTDTDKERETDRQTEKLCDLRGTVRLGHVRNYALITYDQCHGGLNFESVYETKRLWVKCHAKLPLIIGYETDTRTLNAT